MKIRISELLDRTIDEPAVMDPGAAASEASADKIKEAVMQKLSTENRQTRKRRATRIIAVLAAALVLVTSVAAAAVIHHLSIRRVAEDETPAYSYEDSTGVRQSVEYDNAGAVLTVPEPAEESPDAVYEVCWRAAYLPAPESEFKGYSYLDKLESYETMGIGSLEDNLTTSGLTREEAESWHTALWHNADAEGSGFLRIDVYSGALTENNDFIVNGMVVSETQGTINGIEATYLTVDYAGTHLESFGVRHHILLYSEEYRCMADICGDYPMEELVKVAEGLELRQTGMEAVNTFEGFSVIDGAAG